MLAGLAVAACDNELDDFLSVRTPDIVDEETLDPEADGRAFSLSGFQSLGVALSNLAVYSAWFTTEAWVGDTFPTRNEFGRRDVLTRNGTHTNAVWAPVSRAIAQGEQALELLDGLPDQELNSARAAFTSGYGLMLMSEMFCEGTMRQPGNEPGPLMTVTDLQDVALDRLTRAQELASSLTDAEAGDLAVTSEVAIARVHLQAGRAMQATSFADPVDDDFVFEFPYVDQLDERARLGNSVFGFSAGGNRESLVVPPAYREMADDGDPRITFIDAERNAQDGVLNLYSQRKFDNWAAPIALASGLEASYIGAEARRDPAEMLAFVNERREVGDQEPLDTLDPDELLAELMAQRSRDFWLEARRMGDFRRNPDFVPNVLGPPQEYYKPDLGEMRDQMCWPIPADEVDANPNL